jgi:hypothetical protein
MYVSCTTMYAYTNVLVMHLYIPIESTNI